MRISCIVGMHRSGTSLASRVANLLGADLGPEDNLMAAASDNPKGFWENENVRKLNEEILVRFGGRWDRPPALEPGWEHDERLDDIRSRALSLLEDTPITGPVMTWKDPRGSLTLPLWQDLIDVEHALLCLRDPREVAGSLRRRNGLTHDRSARLWLRYTLAALRHVPTATPLLYDEFFSDLEAAANTVASALSLEPPGAQQFERVEEFFDPGLRHLPEPVEDSSEAMALALEVFEVLKDGTLPGPMAWGLERALLQDVTVDAQAEELAKVKSEMAELQQRISSTKEVAREMQDRLADQVREQREERRGANERIDLSLRTVDEAVRSAAEIRTELQRIDQLRQLQTRELDAVLAERASLREQVDQLTQDLAHLRETMTQPRHDWRRGSQRSR